MNTHWGKLPGACGERREDSIHSTQPKDHVDTNVLETEVTFEDYNLASRVPIGVFLAAVNQDYAARRRNTNAG
jgi:hypothetical protein